ncbi:MAG: nuclear transport factor 2 family protein [Burkholderiales bacterium]|nr:MAG: nuclear transport factor 2 family protein [Betaproteobacteria bacterium]TAG64918.1 MAG: nuclear transport factor 2 family protein [Burkholderiales bacterium]
MNPEYFVRLERERTRAIVARDMAVVEAMHAIGYELVTPAGRVFSRERYLELIAEAPFYSAWEHGPMQVRLTQNMAAVKYQARLTFPQGKVVQCWHTDIYELRDSLWQAVWSQATRIPESVEHAG